MIFDAQLALSSEDRKPCTSRTSPSRKQPHVTRVLRMESIAEAVLPQTACTFREVESG
jgi:hypothetical protein